jgi:hypothetical protein
MIFIIELYFQQTYFKAHFHSSNQLPPFDKMQAPEGICNKWKQ